MHVVSRANAVQVAIAVLALTSLPVPRPASADWPALGRALSTAVKDQERPRVASDGAEGAIVVWQDARSPRVNVFAERVLASGDLDPAWPVDGLSVLADSTTLLETAFAGQQSPVIVSDGGGGAIVAWQDGRSEADGLDVYAQHVLAAGAVDPAWPANGRALCTVRGDQDAPAIAPDGEGGAIVTWRDGRSSVTEADIFAQHVLASGAVDPRWPDGGAALCTAPAPQSPPRIAADGAGGALVTWDDARPSPSGTDIYAQHVTSEGIVDPAWPANGLALCRAAGEQLHPTIVPDGANGAVVTWQDARDTLVHVYAQRVRGAGAIAAGWPVNGLVLCTAAVEQVEPVLAADGAGGAIVTWRDARNGRNHNPYAQHVLPSGAVDPAWPVNGRALSLSSGEEASASIIADGGGGAIVAWDEDSSVVVHHVVASGLLDPTFPADGRFVRLLPGFQHDPDLVPSGAGGGIVAWSDAAAGLDFDIYATLVATQAALTVDPVAPGARIAFAAPSPNPARGAVTLRFALPRAAAVRLAIYDVSGRRLRELVSGTQPAGAHQVAWDLRDQGGRPVPAGVCFALLEVEGQSLGGRVVTVR